jgi:hypothetical protein
MQLNRLSLWDEGVADRILNQDILHSPSRGGSTPLFTMDSLPAFSCEQPV